MKSSAALAPASAEDKPSDLTRNIVSLLLFIHLFCVAVALWGNFQRSAIESRLLQVLAPYLRTLNLDPDFTRFYLVHGSQSDDDRFFEVEIVPRGEAVASQAEDGAASDEGAEQGADGGGKLVALPDSGVRGGLARRRYFALSYVMGFYADPDIENETVTGELAKAVGGAVLREQGATRGVVRCKHQMSQPRDLDRLVAGFPEDPRAARYAVTEYEADVWIDDLGQVQVNPRIAALETAAVEQGATESTGAADANNAAQSPANPSTSSGRPSPGGAGSRTQKRPSATGAAGDAAPKTKSPDPRAKSYPFRPLPGKPLPGMPSTGEDPALQRPAGSTAP